jgi:hypothetical protein
MMKQKIAFAMIMGTITTGLISYILISINFGWAHKLLMIWLKAWFISYLIAIPVIILISPMVDKLVKKILPVNQ